MATLVFRPPPHGGLEGGRAKSGLRPRPWHSSFGGAPRPRIGDPTSGDPGVLNNRLRSWIERIALGGMQIELAHSDDLAQVSRLACEIGLELTEASLRDNPAVRLWVARANQGTLLGFLHLWEVADELEVHDLAVAARWRRRGLGRALLTRAMEYGRARGTRVVLLEVRSTNAGAFALYASFGFVPTRRRTAYYANGDDAIEMQLVLERHTAGPRAACEAWHP